MKIFGIGLSKTGTTSLAQALTILGYKTKDYPGLSTYERGNLSSIEARLLDEYDALTDTPIPIFFRELDEKYADAKFILTVRDREGWLASCKKQFTQKSADKQNEAHNAVFLELYNSAVFDEAKFATGYDRFVGAVLEHFRKRPGKLLVMNVVGGEGWEQLCPFLGKPIPDVPFPKANVTRIQWIKVTDLVDVAREAGELLVGQEQVLRQEASEQGDRQGFLNRQTAQVRRLALALRGGREQVVFRAERVANDHIIGFLSRLTPGIPIVSRLSEVSSAEERRTWSHFWLIDPLDGADAFGTAGGQYSVNLALIESRKPIYGVVHAPRSGTTYYATAGKPTIKSSGAGHPFARSQPVGAESLSLSKTQSPASKALRICLLAEGSAAVAERNQ